jgi:predicted ATPase
LGLIESSPKPPLTRLIENLRRKELLLVLDNFEQVSSAAALLAQLLEQCPRLRLLVTSREPLRLRSEQRFLTSPLEPAAAVELFLQRAQAINPDFALTSKSASAVAEICLRLDCLPLAIELAAARSELFTPTELLDQLQRRRLDLLESGVRDLPERHHTLRKAITWSYRLLTTDAQRLFRLLSVFVGRFDLDTLQSIVNAGTGGSTLLPDSDLLTQLQTLVASNLLTPQEFDGRRRYSLLETLREFALEEATTQGEIETIRNHHARHYAAWAEGRASWSFDHEEGIWWRPLEQEQENLRAALGWLVQNDGEQALRLAITLYAFWDTRGEQVEGSRWLAQALALNPAPTRLRAQGLLKAGSFAQQRMEFQPAVQMLDEALAIFRRAGDAVGEAETLQAWGWLASNMGEPARARQCFEASLALFRQLNDQRMVATVLSNLVHVLSYSEAPYAQTRAYAEESLALARALGHEHGIALALRQLGINEMRIGNYAAAAAACHEALTIWQRRGSKREAAWTLEMVGEAYWLLGDVARAADIWREALHQLQTMGEEFGVMIVYHHLGQIERVSGNLTLAADDYVRSLSYFWKLETFHFVARCLAGLGGVALARDKAASAAQLLAAAYRLLETLPPFLAPADQEEYDRLVAHTRHTLGEEAFQRAWAAGTALSTEQAIALAQQKNSEKIFL